MSCSYAEGLSPYENKGKLGLPESVDNKDEFDKKVKQLSKWIEEASHVVIHTGAGISTAAGIPDFRGPNGVWTLEKKGIKPTVNISFDDAKPTPTHMAIVELVKQRKVHYVVSQNIDALHLRSGLSRKYLAELHGNMYVDQCSKCERQFVRKSATNSVGQKNLGTPCPYQGLRPCRGTLHDTILDWEHNLPQRDINLGDYNSSIADLSICLGTTLQINPSGMLPVYTKKYNQGKLVICNLSSTKHDKKADLVIRGYVDDILIGLMDHLGLSIPEYDEKQDPSRSQSQAYQIEWTPLASEVAKVKRRYEEKMRENKKKKVKQHVKEDQDEVKSKKRKVKLEDVKEDRNKLITRKVKQEIKEEMNELDIKKRKVKLEDVNEDRNKLNTRKVKQENNEELETTKKKVKQESNRDSKEDMENIKERKNGDKRNCGVENEIEEDDVSEEGDCKIGKRKVKKNDNRSNRGLETKREEDNDVESEEEDCTQNMGRGKCRERNNGTGSDEKNSERSEGGVKNKIEEDDSVSEDDESELDLKSRMQVIKDVEKKEGKKRKNVSEKINGGRSDSGVENIKVDGDVSEDDESELDLKSRILDVKQEKNKQKMETGIKEINGRESSDFEIANVESSTKTEKVEDCEEQLKTLNEIKNTKAIA